MSVRPYMGSTRYGPNDIRRLFIDETPEKFTMHSSAGRRTLADGEASTPASSMPIVPIMQPEWSSPFWRLMSDDEEMAKSKNWWYFPVRRALVKLAYVPGDWGQRRAERRNTIVRCMRMYLFSNYDVTQIAAATGLKRHEAYRALEDAAFLMTKWIGVFGEEFRAYDRVSFADGLT